MKQEQEAGLPDGWKWVKLGEVCTSVAKVRSFAPEMEFNYFDIGGIDNEKNSIRSFKTVKWKEAPSRAQQIIQAGDILFSTVRTYLKNIAYVENSTELPMVGSTGFTVLRSNSDKVMGKFLFGYILSEKFLRPLNELQTGSSYPAVRDKDVFAQPIPLPPLPTQQAIVTKLEALLQDLDAGIAHLKKAQEQLKLYRQAVLKWAFEGRLTNDHVVVGELPTGWKWVKSGELFSFVTSGSRGWADYYSDAGSIFIRITNLNFDTLDLDLRPEKVQFVKPPIGTEGIRTRVQKNDFLFSITGYLGMFALAPDLESAYVNQHVCLCRPKDDFNHRFVGYWIISKSGANRHFNDNKKGAVKAGLNLDDLKTFPVPLPNRNEQDKISSEIDKIFEEIEQLNNKVSTQLDNTEALRQSVLKAAFEGRL